MSEMSILAIAGLGLMVGLAGAGSAWGLSVAGQAVMGMLKKRPNDFGKGMILSSMPATQGIYGFVAFMMFSGEVTSSMSPYKAAVVFAAGLAIGVACLISGIYQGKVCAAGIATYGSGNDKAFGNTLILAAFPEFYAILSLVASIMMIGLLGK